MKTNGFIYLFIGLMACLGLLVAFVSGIHIGLRFSPSEYEQSMLPTLAVLGTWVGAFATCSAVIVSLWLALKQLSQDKEILDCNLNMHVIPGYQDQPCIGLSIVSKGNKPTNINSLSWYGEGARAAMTVTHFNPYGSKLPQVLSYGQQISLLHVQDFEEHIAKYVREYMDGNFENLYLSVNTTTGSERIKLSDSMLSYLRESESANK